MRIKQDLDAGKVNGGAVSYGQREGSGIRSFTAFRMTL
jgi:hypothetical protein